MKFAYSPLPVRQSSPALRGAQVRFRPLVPIHVLSPQVLPPVDACIDSGSDDTVFPGRLAARLGLNLASLPTGQAQLVGGATVSVGFAQVTLLLSDGYETCEWDAVVGFATGPMRWALLGHTAFHEFFDVQLLGARREATVIPNTTFPGQHIVHVIAPS